MKTIRIRTFSAAPGNNTKKHFFLAFCLFAFVLSSLTARPATEQDYLRFAAQTVSGAITNVDRYGNVATDITGAALAGAGFELGDVVRLVSGNFNGETPMVTTYADVQRGNPLVRVNNGFLELSISYGNFAQTNGVSVGTPVTVTMVTKGAYKAELEIRNLTRTQERADYASDAIFANFREARLGSIRANLLYRSCHPALGDARAPYAALLGEQARVVTVINMADTPQELVERGASVPWYQAFITNGNIIALGMGVDYKNPDFAAKLKTGLEFMLTRSGPFLVHCNEGKDRAGVVAALFGALMGASTEQIVEDYMLSYENYYGVTRGEERYTLISSIMRDILKDFNEGVMPGPGETVGAAEKYLRGVIGFTPAQISSLKLKLAGN